MQVKSMLRILAVIAFFIGLDSLIVSPLLPAISQTIGMPAEKGGLLITAYALCYGITAPFFGPLSDKVGRKQMIVTGLIIFSAATFCTGLTNHFEILLLFRGLTGLSGAMIMPSVFALVGDKVPYQSRRKAMGMIMGAMVGSTVLGVPIGAFLSEVGNWQWTFYIIGLLALLVTLITSRLLQKEISKNQLSISAPKAMIGSCKIVFTNFSVFFALLATFLWTVGLHGMFSYIGVYYGRNFGFTIGQIGIVIFFAGLGSVIGNIAGGKLADKIGKKVVVSIASIFASISVILFSVYIGNVKYAITAHMIWSICIGFGQASLTALISELNPAIRGTVMALNSSAMYIGMTIASSVASFALSKGLPFFVLGIICAIASLLVLPSIYFLVQEKATTTKNQIGI
ncbi:MFS transporter [Bacillus pseudomycoides]|uniref:MFS transporter n=1 Tax=Bacillus pseudomycoides TaxID=64104 RepID=UPI000BFA4A43|nr:MFS transporter [Bacillus pseudomycoides]PGE97755.1 MFS transporter [Bacillus pseudomycoides]PHE36603.1 MFS transporter [Bacillus pseudomycoides]